jgi:hypothetical protein
MHQPLTVLVTLSLLAWPTGPAAAVPPGCEAPPAPAGGPIRFEIRHGPGGQPGHRASPDGRLTVAVVADLQARVVEAGSGTPAGPVLGHSRRRPGIRIHAWAFSGDGRLLATASSQGAGEDTVGEVRVWEVAGGRLLAVATDARYPLGRVHTVAFAPDGRTVVIHCDDISGK